jgi:hypothetical protein
MTTLKMRKTDKSGATSYAIDGLKRSVYFNAGMFAEGKIPATVEIALPSGFAFASPVAPTPKAPRVPLTPAQKVKAAKAALATAQKAVAAAATPKPVAVAPKATAKATPKGKK